LARKHALPRLFFQRLRHLL